MPSRNDACPCGSGRKYKRCCMNKESKPRYEVISRIMDASQIDPETGDIEVELFIDGVNGRSDLISTRTGESVLTNDASITRGYFGDKRFKVLSDIPLDLSHPAPNIKHQLLDYGCIVAIDTNTNIGKDGNSVSIGIAHQVLYVDIGHEGKYHYIPLPMIFRINEKVDKPENYNWRQLIRFMTIHQNYNPKMKHAIIVDSDLGNHRMYNSREMPIIEDFFLPENFQLIYASDAAADTFMNLAVRKCGSLATKIIKEIIKTS